MAAPGIATERCPGWSGLSRASSKAWCRFASSRPERPARSVATVEVVLRNGRALLVSEAIAPEMLGRLAAALDARWHDGHALRFRRPGRAGADGAEGRSVLWSAAPVPRQARRPAEGALVGWPGLDAGDQEARRRQAHLADNRARRRGDRTVGSQAGLLHPAGLRSRSLAGRWVTKRLGRPSGCSAEGSGGERQCAHVPAKSTSRAGALRGSPRNHRQTASRPRAS